MMKACNRKAAAALLCVSGVAELAPLPPLPSVAELRALLCGAPDVNWMLLCHTALTRGTATSTAAARQRHGDHAAGAARRRSTWLWLWRLGPRLETALTYSCSAPLPQAALRQQRRRLNKAEAEAAANKVAVVTAELAGGRTGRTAGPRPPCTLPSWWGPTPRGWSGRAQRGCSEASASDFSPTLRTSRRTWRR